MKRLLHCLLAMLLMLPLLGITAAAKESETNLALGRPVKAQTHVANQGSYSELDKFSEAVLTDGAFGSNSFSDPAWAKFYRATGRILTVDLGESCTVNRIRSRFLQQSEAGIVAPGEIKVFVSQNGTDFARATVKSGNLAPYLPSAGGELLLAEYNIELQPLCARFVAISFDVTVNSFTDELEIFGTAGSTLQPSSDFCHIIEPSKGEYLDRNALDGDYDLVCFHAGYSPENPGLVNNTKEAFLPYLGYMDSSGKITDTMFDSVLFLTLQGKCPSGGDLTISNGPTVISDWLTLLDNYFDPQYNLAAIDAATAEIKKTLSLPDTHKTSVYLTIPYPKIGETLFGDFTGDGVDDKIASYSDCLAVTQWFMDQVDKRLGEANFENIELKGYFCNSEGLTRQRYDYEFDFARDAAELMHSRGLKCVMIPYYQAVGIDKNQELNFDAMLMQPNLSFNDTLKDDPAGTMADFAETAKQLGLGIQMEIADGVRWEPEKLGVFYEQYLASASRNGLMTDTVHAYYNGAGPGVFFDCQRSKNGYTRWFYDATYKFIKGTLDLPEAMLSDEYTKAMELDSTRRYSGETGLLGDWYCEYQITKQPAHGHVNLVNGASSFSILADRKYVGTDSFEYDIIHAGRVIAHRVVELNIKASDPIPSEDPKAESAPTADPSPEKSRLPLLAGAALAAAMAILAVIVIKKKKKK